MVLVRLTSGVNTGSNTASRQAAEAAILIHRADKANDR